MPTNCAEEVLKEKPVLKSFLSQKECSALRIEERQGFRVSYKFS